MFLIEDHFCLSPKENDEQKKKSNLQLAFSSESLGFRQKISDFCLTFCASCKSVLRLNTTEKRSGGGNSNYNLKERANTILEFLDKLESEVFDVFPLYSTSDIRELLESILFPRVEADLLALYRQEHADEVEAFSLKLDELKDCLACDLGLDRSNKRNIIKEEQTCPVSPGVFPINSSNISSSFSSASSSSSLLLLSRYEQTISFFRQVPQVATPKEKIHVIQEGFRSLSEVWSSSHSDNNNDEDSSSQLGADDLCPLLSFLVIKAHVPDLICHCFFIEHFSSERAMSLAHGYCLVSLKAIFYFISHLQWRTITDNQKKFLVIDNRIHSSYSSSSESKTSNDIVDIQHSDVMVNKTTTIDSTTSSSLPSITNITTTTTNVDFASINNNVARTLSLWASRNHGPNWREAHVMKMTRGGQGLPRRSSYNDNIN